VASVDLSTRERAGHVVAALRGEQDPCGSAWLSAARDAEAGHLMRVTDEVSERIAELQLTLGEGPSLDASASGGPALASDLAGGNRGPAGRRSRRRHARPGRRPSSRSRWRSGRSGPGCWACTGTGPAR
jgi:hypothetical protein